MNDSDYYGSGSLETTFACERARLVRLCAKFTGEGDVAEDLAQETLFEAWRHIHNLRSQDRLPQWLSGIAHNVCLRWARKRGRDLLQLAEPLHDPDASQTDLEDALVDDFDLEIELALAIVATMLGPTPARVAPVQAGPYPLTVSLYTDPANAGYALPFAIAPQQQQCGVLTFDLTSVPGTGVVATPVHASLAPDSNVRNGVQGAAKITVRGMWNLLVSVDGPQGHAEASVPVTATAPPAIPLWLGWIIGLIPLYGLLAFMLLQRSRKEKLA